MKTFFKNFHSKNFLRNGVPIETIVSSIDWPQDFIKIILNLLIAEKHVKKSDGVYCLISYSNPMLTKLQIEQIDSIETLIKNSGLVPVEKKALQNIKDYKPSQLLDIINFLKSKSKIVDLGDNFFIHRDYFFIIIFIINNNF